MSFVNLHMPAVEDGNNFYVGMQEELAKLAWETIKTLNGLADERVVFFEKRADMKEKIYPKQTDDTTASTQESNSDETKGTEQTKTAKKENWSKSDKKTSNW